jgi:hypothetical protein
VGEKDTALRASFLLTRPTRPLPALLKVLFYAYLGALGGLGGFKSVTKILGRPRRAAVPKSIPNRLYLLRSAGRKRSPMRGVFCVSEPPSRLLVARRSLSSC